MNCRFNLSWVAQMLHIRGRTLHGDTSAINSCDDWWLCDLCNHFHCTYILVGNFDAFSMHLIWGLNNNFDLLWYIFNVLINCLFSSYYYIFLAILWSCGCNYTITRLIAVKQKFHRPSLFTGFLKIFNKLQNLPTSVEEYRNPLKESAFVVSLYF